MFAQRLIGAAKHGPIAEAASYRRRTRPVNRLFPFCPHLPRPCERRFSLSFIRLFSPSPRRGCRRSRPPRVSTLAMPSTSRQLALPCVVRQQRRGLRVVGVQAHLEGFRIVVGPAFGLETAWRRGRSGPASSTFSRMTASIFWPRPASSIVQRLGLGHRAREAVEDDRRRAFGSWAAAPRSGR